MTLKIVRRVCLILIFLSTQSLAQTQPPAATPPGATLRPIRPSAPAASAQAYCIYRSEQYSIGATVCLSNQLLQTCAGPDSTHSSPWWQGGQQPLCSGGAPASGPAASK
jgi:hypothetical protein